MCTLWSEAKQIRSAWSEEEEKWYFSVVDIIEALTGTDRPRKYWSDLKTKLKNEGSQLSEKIGQLKMLAEDGKIRDTDVADAESSTSYFWLASYKKSFSS